MNGRLIGYLTYCAVKWRCLRGNKRGESLESTTFEQKIKEPFIIFNTNRITYNYKKEFNNTGEFHRVCLDPKFGTNQNRDNFDKDADKKIRECKQFNVLAEVGKKLSHYNITFCRSATPMNEVCSMTVLPI